MLHKKLTECRMLRSRSHSCLRPAEHGPAAAPGVTSSYRQNPWPCPAAAFDRDSPGQSGCRGVIGPTPSLSALPGPHYQIASQSNHVGRTLRCRSSRILFVQFPSSLHLGHATRASAASTTTLIGLGAAKASRVGRGVRRWLPVWTWPRTSPIFCAQCCFFSLEIRANKACRSPSWAQVGEVTRKQGKQRGMACLAVRRPRPNQPSGWWLDVPMRLEAVSFAAQTCTPFCLAQSSPMVSFPLSFAQELHFLVPWLLTHLVRTSQSGRTHLVPCALSLTPPPSLPSPAKINRFLLHA